MRILIVGGGVAGLTLAAKLRRQGREPIVIERAPEYTDAGYGLGLWPLGSCVFHGLGIFDGLVDQSSVVGTYEIRGRDGDVVQSVDLSDFTQEMGPMLMMSRTVVIDLLREACRDVAIHMNASIESIEQRDDVVHVDINGVYDTEFDVVIGCDGIHSEVRREVFGEQPVFDTGWTIWTWWADTSRCSPDTFREYWGHGWFFGAYPCPDKLMCGVGLPNDRITDHHGDTDDMRAAFVRELERLVAHDKDVADAIGDADSFFAWPMTDVRSEEWHAGRIGLCGDAATAFLPTAGVGASNALRGAAALADELSRADAKLAPVALELFEKRSRKTIEGNQSDSRKIARVMFLSSGALSVGRDVMLKHVSPNRFVHDVVASMKNPF